MIMSGKDSSLLCPKLVPGGLNLQVHGNRNSMMQIITYNPVDQDPFFFPFRFYRHDFYHNSWCLLAGFHWWRMLKFTKSL